MTVSYRQLSVPEAKGPLQRLREKQCPARQHVVARKVLDMQHGHATVCYPALPKAALFGMGLESLC